MMSRCRRSLARLGISQPTTRFVAPVLLALAVMLAASIASLEVLSTIRAYVGGESLYSKGQKNATYYLAQYTVSHADADLRLYARAIALPLGDRKARLALQAPVEDISAAREGFLAGGNDPADIDSIIRLFRWFGHVSLMRQAIDIWTEGDAYTLRICALAARMQEVVHTDSESEEAAVVRAELQRINRELTPLSARFASTLGAAARLTRTALVFAMTISTLLTGVLCVQVIRARVKERDAKERGLTRMTELYEALSRTSQLIARVSDRHHLFDELCRICVGTSGLNRACVGSFTGAASVIDFVAAHVKHPAPGPPRENADEAVSSQQLESARFAIRSGRPHVGNGESRLHGHTYQSWASFPLHCQGKVVAVLSVSARETLFFEDDIVELMEQLSMEVSFALDSLQRETTRRYQAALLADQNRILNLIASGADLPVIFSTLAQFVETTCPNTCCLLVSLNQTGESYSDAAAPSLPVDLVRAIPGSLLRQDGAAWTRAILTRSAVQISPLTEDSAESRLLQAAESARSSLAAWPIVGSHGQLLGAIAIGFRGPGEPAQPEAQFLTICTDLAGIAIEGHRAAERIRHLAQHDELTGLPNRLFFNETVPKALRRADRVGGTVGVLFLDLDRFKNINDTLGHGAGDLVLCQVSAHLRECLRETDTLARLGGDEFTVLVEALKNPEDLAEIAEKLLCAVAKPLVVGGQECQLSGSIGIAIYPKDGVDGAILLKNADIAMYRAKSSGRNNFQFYAQDMNQHSLERLSLESDLRRAVERREFLVHYQPKVDIQTGRIAGAEALVRWQHPVRGLISPAVFIGVAEEAGIIGSIGRLVLEAACMDAKRWHAQGFTALRIAVNLSAQQFSDFRLLLDLDRVLRETDCRSTSLEIEITESVVMTNPEKALSILSQIKEREITLAIDDFGTGHSSLAYLQRFPVDSIKIDRAFVRDISSNPHDLAITKAIIALGHSMGLKVVAEGVETEQQLAILRRHRCDEFQGFLVSRPLPAGEFEGFLHAGASVVDA
jgi:diguanylate cyclase (GGDEF)-like protein